MPGDAVRYSEHLTRAEYDCPCGFCEHVSPLADLLVVYEAIRGRLGIPLRVLSGYRCPRHNQAAGGSAYSAHMLRAALDIGRPAAVPMDKFVAICSVFLGVGGLGRYDELDYVHVDVLGRHGSDDVFLRRRRWRR
jgi:uncharacterized protein YcbK (DUF882 family)